MNETQAYIQPEPEPSFCKGVNADEEMNRALRRCRASFIRNAYRFAAQPRIVALFNGCVVQKLGLVRGPSVHLKRGFVYEKLKQAYSNCAVNSVNRWRQPAGV